MTQSALKTTIITPVFRVSYPYVFEARFNQLSKKQEFTITMLFDKKTAKDDLKELKTLCGQITVEKFGPSIPPGFRSPFKDGDEDNAKKKSLGKPVNESQKGMIVVVSKSQYMPGLVDQKKQPIINKDEFYGGCYARAQVNIYAYSKAGNSGVNLGLLHLQKVKDGEPLGNRTRPEDAFAPISEDEISDNFLDDQPPADQSKGLFD